MGMPFESDVPTDPSGRDGSGWERRFSRPEGTLLTGNAFLAENPEAFGLVPDACPVASRRVLLAANGHAAESGAFSPSFVVEAEGTDGLFDRLYAGLMPRTDENTQILRATFGESRGDQEHLIARYCAVLTETEAFEILNGRARDASPEQTSVLLSDAMVSGLRDMKDMLTRNGAVSDADGAFFRVSFGAVRLSAGENGDFAADVFSAGDFSVYLLDGDGMRPLWTEKTPPLSPDSPSAGTDEPAVRSGHFAFRSPGPFALLLLSDSIGAINAAEKRALKETPGLVWRYRMRLEDTFLRLFTSFAHEQDFRANAVRLFTGRSSGRDSASGAMLIRTGETVSYELFRTACRKRLSELENVISLLQDGYDPDRVTPLPDREETERECLRRLLNTYPGLQNRVMEAVGQCVEEKLKNGPSADVPPPPPVPDWKRLTYDTVFETFRRYDVANDGDRQEMAEARSAMRDSLSDHWMTFRPLLCGDRFSSVENRRTFDACERLNRRLSAVLSGREQALTALETCLSSHLDALRAGKSDFLYGRAVTGTAESGVKKLATELPGLLHPFLVDSRTETDRLHSLFTAYTTERERLFRLDTEPGSGVFSSEWEELYEGIRKEEAEEALHRLATDASCPLSYRDLFRAVLLLSEHVRSLSRAVETRASVRRTAEDLAGQYEWQLICLRASAYEDTDFGTAVVGLMDGSMRAEYHATVRRWQETVELHARQEEAYRHYKQMYETYVPDRNTGISSPPDSRKTGEIPETGQPVLRR